MRSSDPKSKELETAEVLAALRHCFAQLYPPVTEHDWGHYFAFSAPLVFAYLWPHSHHVTLGVLHGVDLQRFSSRLQGRGPTLRTMMFCRPEEVDEEVRIVLQAAARLARATHRR